MRVIIFLSIIAMSMASCSRVYYAPNTPNPTLFTDKDQLNVNAMFVNGNQSDLRGGELQMAYSIKKNWGMMFNIISGGKTQKTGDYTESGHGTYGEAAGGYFKNLDKKNDWIAEIYFGYGGGSVKSDYKMRDNSRVSISKFFMQPAIGFTSENFEFAFSSRLGLVKWKVQELNIIYTDPLEELNFIADNPSFFVLEPAFVVRAGSKNVKAQLGISFSSSKMGVFILGGLAETATINLGLSFRFNAPKN